MALTFHLHEIQAPQLKARAGQLVKLSSALLVCAVCFLPAAGDCNAQVITVGTGGNGPIILGTTVDRRYSQITPTSVPLTQSTLDAKTRMDLIRVMQAEQGFAMRPLPRGHKGLTLVANGNLDPAGEAYLNMVIEHGTSAKPGDRVVITDVKFDHNKIVFLLNGGPDLKHRFLRHISIGADPNYDAPVVQDDQTEPVGSRLTLNFKGNIPELTGAQVKALLAPLISFDVKTPIQAYTDTLPTPLKDAILNHHVMVGMSTDMVLFAKGQPQTKSREMDGQMPFEEWIYGTPPEEVDFVRINGNRVIRVEIAKAGESPEIFTKDEVSGMLTSKGGSVETAQNRVHIAKEGDVQRDPDKEAPAPPPSLRNPGEQLPADDPNSRLSPGQRNAGAMKPVQAPVKKPEYQIGVNPDGVQETPAPATSTAPAKPAAPPQNPEATKPGSDQPN